MVCAKPSCSLRVAWVAVSVGVGEIDARVVAGLISNGPWIQAGSDLWGVQHHLLNTRDHTQQVIVGVVVQVRAATPARRVQISQPPRERLTRRDSLKGSWSILSFFASTRT